jgi:hypothetical protein
LTNLLEEKNLDVEVVIGGLIDPSHLIGWLIKIKVSSDSWTSSTSVNLAHLHFVWLRMNETSMWSRSQTNKHADRNKRQTGHADVNQNVLEKTHRKTNRGSHNLVRMKFLVAVACLTVSVSAFTAMAPRRVGVNSLSVAQQK